MGGDQSWLIHLFFFIHGTLLVIGILVCVSFLFALFRGRKVLNKWPFYRIVWSLATMDTIFMIAQTYSFPSMISSNGNSTHDIEKPIPNVVSVFNSPILETAIDIVNYIPQKAWEIINAFSSSSLQGVLYFTLLISFNRLAVFVFPSLKILFTKDKIGQTIVLTWLWIVCMSAVSELLQPTQEWNYELLKFEDTGPAFIDVPLLRLISDIIDYIIPFVIVVIYFHIYYIIRKGRRFINSGSMSGEIRIRGSDESRLLYQGIIIASFLQMSNVVNIVSTIIEQDDWLEIFLNIVDMTTSVLNHSVHSFLFLLTNPTIRSFLPHISLRCCERSQIH